MATRDEVKSIIGYLILAFPNYHPDLTSAPSTIDVYEDLLGDLDGETLRMAVREACKEDRAFAPAPGEIRATMYKLPERFRLFAPVINQIETVEFDPTKPFYLQFPKEKL